MSDSAYLDVLWPLIQKFQQPSQGPNSLSSWLGLPGRSPQSTAARGSPSEGELETLWTERGGAKSLSDVKASPPELSDKKEPSSKFIKKLIPVRSGPTSSFEVKALDCRLWALVIGINVYSSKQRLNGAVADANAISQYLETTLKVPKDHIVNLRDQDATRSNIISAFEALRDDDRIEREDPILIYYAGHGGKALRDGTEDTIETLIPVDYVPRQVSPIPDRTIASLINGISNKRGNNITVILDCCHSGSGTRGDENETVRAFELDPNDVPDGLDADILNDPANLAPSDGARGLHTAHGFAVQGMKSHVLLAACSANELAREGTQVRHAAGGQPTLDDSKEASVTVRGRFTTALLELFENVSPSQITYAGVLDRILPIEGQNPQCEGFHSDRILFDAKVSEPTRKAYEVRLEGRDRYILQAGKIRGITDGAQFTLYRDKKVALLETPLGVMKVDGNIGAFTTMLKPVNEGKLPVAFDNPAVAVQTRAGAAEDLLIHVPVDRQNSPIFEAVAQELSGVDPNPCRIRLVDKDKAQLEIAITGGNLTFIALDQRAREYGFTRMPQAVDANAENLQNILRSAAHYHFHLNVTQPNNQIQDKFPIEFFPLKEEGGEDSFGSLVPGDNMHRRGRIEYEVEVEDGTTFGMRITNKTPWDLYFCCLFFDHADFSISAITEVNIPTHHRKDANLKKGQTVKIGYDDSSIPPFESVIREGLNLTIGFLKFYFTSEVTNLSHIPQPSPFDSVRGLRLADNSPKKPVWGTILIPVIQRRRR